MKRQLFWRLGILLVLGISPAAASPAFSQGAPAEADKLIKEFQVFEAETLKKAEADIAARREKLFADLQALLEALTKAGNLDGAVAVRDRIKHLKIAAKLKGAKILPNPGNLSSFKNLQPGEVMYFKVTGKIGGGAVWGTDFYTLDSDLAGAAVHAGVLKSGEEGLVKVTIAPGRDRYQGSARSGVTSEDWGSYELSYQVDAVQP